MGYYGHDNEPSGSTTDEEFFWRAEQLSASEEEFCFMEFVTKVTWYI